MSSGNGDTTIQADEQPKILHLKEPPADGTGFSSGALLPSSVPSAESEAGFSAASGGGFFSPPPGLVLTVCLVLSGAGKGWSLFANAEGGVDGESNL